MDTGRLLDAITRRLEQDGFVISHEEVGGHHAVVARRAQFHWTLTRLHVFAFLFELRTVDDDKAEQLASAARDYAVAHKGGLPRGLQTGVASIPVIISHEAAERAKEWARSNQRRKRHWAAIDFPVVIELATGDLSYQATSAFWGAAYLPQLRRVVADDIAPAVSAAA